MTYGHLVDLIDAPIANGLIVDIGALEYAGGEEPPYAALTRRRGWRVLGFDALAQDDAVAVGNRGHAQVRCLPYAIADGKPRTFRTCNYPMTSSLLEPNARFLSRFVDLGEFCEVVDRRPLETRPLDSITEAEGTNFLKIDVQGATMEVIEGGEATVRGALVIHTEVDFAPLYEGEATFGALYDRLLSLGFALHHFAPLTTRALKGMPQPRTPWHLWGDGVFVPDFKRMERLETDGLMKLGAIMHDCYGAYDVVCHALMLVDRRGGTEYEAAYRRKLREAEA